MFGNKLINTNAGGGCTNTVDLYNPFPDGGGLALYQLNGDATDVSGNYNGTATNVTYGAGEFGQAGVFNGSNSYISNTSISGFPSGAAARTLSFWVNAQGSGVRVIGGYGNAAPAQYFGLSITLENAINFLGYNYNLTTTYTIPQNQWVNIVTTYDGTTQLLYANGVQVYSVARTYNTVSSEFRIGDDLWGTTERFEGSIDQVRVFNRALRPYEVEALYTEEYCTPTIVPSEHFNTVLYSGNSSTQSVTGVGFQPDMVWIKSRNISGANHVLTDSVRGTGKFILPNLTDGEYTSAAGTLSSFDADGFSLSSPPPFYDFNVSGNNYVAWNFKAGGSAVTNTDGTITSQVSANTEAGFSVVGWTGNGSNNVTIGHGLESIPDMFIIKDRSVSQNWYIWQKDLAGDNYGLDFGVNPQATFSFGTVGTKTASTITAVAGGNGISNLNTNGSNYIGYFFSEVEGFSNFGSYVGTGVVGNVSVVTGFEPAMIIAKRTDAGSSNWFIWDNKRDTTNPNGTYLLPNDSNAENDLDAYGMNFFENGFTVNSSDPQLNASGGSYIYMAFAADPTTIEPSLEDSFNTVTYTGNGGTQTIGGVFEGGGSFNGSSSIIKNTSLGTNYRGQTNLSLSAWFKTSAASGRLTIMSFSATGDASTDLFLGIDSDTVGFRNINDGSNNLQAENISGSSVRDGNWHHVVFTADSSGNKLYVDGSQISINYDFGSASTPIVMPSDLNQFNIGANQDSSGEQWFMNGSIDQVRIFDTALTAAQVTELYEETDADSHTLDFPSGAGAVALYELNGNANDTGGTYNGTASNVTWLHNGVGFQPDFVWIKNRQSPPLNSFNLLFDSVRGATKWLSSNATNVEGTIASSLTSFDSNGFSLGTDPDGANEGWNISGNEHVAWCWKGAELPAINSNGSIPSVVSANPAAGFSIVSYTGTGSSNTIVGTGLDTECDFVIIKNRNNTNGSSWIVQRNKTDKTKYLYLNDTRAESTSTAFQVNINTNNGTFEIDGTDRGVNTLNDNFIAYCFHSVAGFSKFGSYTGNAPAGGTGSTIPINCGFEPAFVMIKWTSGSVGYGAWGIWDNKRDTTNPNTKFLQANSSSAELDLSSYSIDFDSNGFTVGAAGNDITNISGNSYIYMAFANQF